MTEDEINKLIDECIDQLADDNTRVGAESLVELAHVWANAGIDISSFLDIRKYIINEAIERTDPMFIEEKLQQAEQLLRETRCGSTIITH